MDSPNDVDNVDTFYFGNRDGDDYEGRDWCERQCRNKQECTAYTFYSNYGGNSGDMGNCYGKSDIDDVMNSYLWSYSGKRVYCSNPSKSKYTFSATPKLL